MGQPSDIGVRMVQIFTNLLLDMSDTKLGGTIFFTIIIFILMAVIWSIIWAGAWILGNVYEWLTKEETK